MSQHNPSSEESPLVPKPPRAIIRIDDSDGLSGPLPGWVRGLAEDYQQLRDDADRLLPSGHSYDFAPDLDSSSSRQEFLEKQLGVRFGRDYVERTCCSSYDWDAFVYADEVDALSAAEEANLDKLKDDLIAEATAALVPKGLSYHDKLDLLRRLALAKDPAFVRRVEQDDQEASEAEELRAELEEIEERLNTQDKHIEELEEEVRRRHTLRREAVAKALADGGRYDALALALQVRFGITINGPLLTLRDGSRYLLTGIFGLELKDWPSGPELLAWDEVASGRIRKVRIRNSHLRGWKPPAEVDAAWIKNYYSRPHDWSRAWWYYFAFFQGHKLRLSPDTELKLGLSAEEISALQALGRESWYSD